MEIAESNFERLPLKAKLSALYENTEEINKTVKCLAQKKEKLVPTIIKWSAATAVGVYVLFQAVPIESALPIIRVILGG
jgi:hypothetical protein